MSAAVPGATDTDRDDFCTGRGDARGDHCCYVMGQTCRYLAVNEDPEEGERRFECSLRRDLGSWEAVHQHSGYQEHVQSVWDQVGISSCGEWQPDKGVCCREAR